MVKTLCLVQVVTSFQWLTYGVKVIHHNDYNSMQKWDFAYFFTVTGLSSVTVVISSAQAS